MSPFISQPRLHPNRGALTACSGRPECVVFDRLQRSVATPWLPQAAADAGRWADRTEGTNMQLDDFGLRVKRAVSAVLSDVGHTDYLWD